MIFSEHEKTVVWAVFRTVVYFFVVLGLMVGLWQIAHIFHAEAFMENGLIENIQCSALMTGVVLFSVEAIFIKSYRSILFGLASLCLFGVCRELDALMDNYVPVLSWKVGFIFPAIAVLYSLIKIKSLKKKIIAFFETPGFYLMLAAMIIIIPIAECIGHKPSITSVLGTDVVSKPVQRLIEESGELAGYALILLAGIELIFNLKNKKLEK